MKDYNYWIKAIERDILEPDKIHIHLGHLKQSLLNLDETRNAVLGEVQTDLEKLYESYCDLLNEAMGLYAYYPNNFRKTAEEYFKNEIGLMKKIEEKHFA